MIKDQAVETLLNRYLPGKSSLADPSSPAFEGSWKNVFAGPRAKWKDAALELWKPFGSVLPTFTQVHSELLVDVLPARCEGLRVVIYCYEINDRLWLYRGGMPLTKEGQLRYLENLPPTLLEFYRSLHNGFTFIPGNSVGPLPKGEMFPLDEVECEWLSDAEDPDQFEPLDEKQVIFWNGDAGYIALDVASKLDDDATAFIWWKAEPPVVQNFWPLLDAWMEIGLTK